MAFSEVPNNATEGLQAQDRLLRWLTFCKRLSMIPERKKPDKQKLNKTIDRQLSKPKNLACTSHPEPTFFF